MPMNVEEGVAALFAATEKVERLEAELKLAKTQKSTLERDLLPPIFMSASCLNFTHDSGRVAKLGTIITGSLPKDTDDNPHARRDAIEYASRLGGDPFIMTTVEASWDKGDRDKALRWYAELRRQDNSAKASVAEDIHHMTLKAWVGRLLKAGTAIETAKLGIDAFQGVTFAKRRKSTNSDEEI